MRPPQPRSTLFPYTTLFRSIRPGDRGATEESMHLVDTTLFYSPTSGGVKRYLTAKHAWLAAHTSRSEEHTSELQSHSDLVCRLLLEKKKNNKRHSKQ